MPSMGSFCVNFFVFSKFPDIEQSICYMFSLIGQQWSHFCRELGIGIVCYSPLGRGFFAGKAVVEKLEEKDYRIVSGVSPSQPTAVNYDFSICVERTYK